MVRLAVLGVILVLACTVTAEDSDDAPAAGAPAAGGPLGHGAILCTLTVCIM